MSGRDRQRGRVYAWEDATVAPRDRTLLPFAAADGMVRAIWAELGLRFPPGVEKLPRQSRCLGDATRLSIRLPDRFASWCLLHEMAHSLACDQDGADGSADGAHGAVFMGLYLQLLTRYLRLSPVLLADSAAAHRLRVRSDARPAFVDPPAPAFPHAALQQR